MIENYSWQYLKDKSATPMYKTIGDLLTQEEGKSILDIGCGYSRWNEFYNGNATIVGYDNNIEAISYCKDHYPNHTWFIEDCWTYRFKEQFDIIILSGILYYCKNDNIFSPLQYVSQLIDDHKPKIIIVQEPMPNVFYKSPDFLLLFDKYAYEIFYHELDIRMGRRCVYKFYVDQIRPHRRIKKEYLELPNIIRQSDFNLNVLQNGVYTINTENLNNEIDGLINCAEKHDKYVSLCSGIKGFFKCLIDWTRYKHNFEFVWYDVNPTALNYRLYCDNLLSSNLQCWDIMFEKFKTEINPNAFEIKDKNKSIDSYIDEQLSLLNINKDQWCKFLNEYIKCKKRYIKIDVVNNVKLFTKLLKDSQSQKVWLWYSNVFDWHQFRYQVKSFVAWENFIQRNIINIKLLGKRPTYSIEKNILNYILNYIIYIMRDIHKIKCYDDLLENIATDLLNTIRKEDPNYNIFLVDDNIIFKKPWNPHNCCFYNSVRKYKIFTGLNAKLSAYNHEIINNQVTKFLNKKYGTIGISDVDILIFQSSFCRIESYPIIQGDCLGELLRLESGKENIINMKFLIDKISELLIKIVSYSADGTPNNQKYSYSYDLKPDNIVIEHSTNELKIIDFDYMVIGDFNLFLQHSVNRLVDHIFNEWDYKNSNILNLNSDKLKSNIITNVTEYENAIKSLE